MAREERCSLHCLYRFGNYIGEAEESEDGSQHDRAQVDGYVDGEGSEHGLEGNDQQLMELDGVFHHPTFCRYGV